MVELDRLFPEHLALLQRTADRALAASHGEALMIGAGQLRTQFLDDRTDPYVANPHFKHWAPILDAPGSFVLHCPGKRPRLLFHQPKDYWHKPPVLPSAAWLDAFEVVVIRSPLEARSVVPAHTIYIGDDSLQDRTDWGFQAINPPAALACLHYARAIKTPYELACMRSAATLGARAHKAAAAAFAAGASEYDIHLRYLAATGLTEAELPYSNIIATNAAGAVLHYTELSRVAPSQYRSLLIDAGAQVRGYASDITRTYATAPGPFQTLLTGMDQLQQRLCALVTGGVYYPDIHLQAHREIGQLLIEQGLISCSLDQAIEQEVTSVFFPHGIGHLLGLQVHDIGGHQQDEQGTQQPPPKAHPYLRLTRRLEPGMVVTIEPGIYFIPMLLERASQDHRRALIHWAQVDALLPYGGIRIEDDVLATEQGADNLSRVAFSALA
jgi:Xaa-Pro dipeptidase